MINESLHSSTGISVTIPALPELSASLNDLVRQPGIELAEVGRHIASDRTIASHVLTLANSPIFSLRQSMDTIEQAATVLGLNALQNIILQAAVIETFRPSRLSDMALFTAFWKHAILTGFVASNLTREVPAFYAMVDADMLYTAGLLHDIGRIALYNSLGGEYSELLSSAYEGSGVQSKEERELGVNHADVGAVVASRWKLPESVRSAISVHHDREAMLAGSIEGWILYAANRIADMIENEDMDRIMLLQPGVGRLMHIGRSGFTQVVGRAERFYSTIEMYVLK